MSVAGIDVGDSTSCIALARKGGEKRAIALEGKRSEFAAHQFCVRLGFVLEKQAAATLGASEISRRPAAAADTSADGSGLAVGTRCLSVGLLPPAGILLRTVGSCLLLL